jgi:3-hydroxymyristoyl/3-hydroxydecanoyl-(acyl carrier protein) dehydratase
VPGSCDKHFADDHPTAAGHFPGNPIIPGALLLDSVLQAIAGDGIAAPCTIRAVKFLRPVRPGDSIRISWREERGETHFQCVLTGTQDLMLTGTLRLGTKPG